MGSDDLNKLTARYNFTYEAKFTKNLKDFPKRSWSEFINDSNKDFCNDDAFDLLTKMIKYDPEERIYIKKRKYKYFIY